MFNNNNLFMKSYIVTEFCLVLQNPAEIENNRISDGETKAWNRCKGHLPLKWRLGATEPLELRVEWANKTVRAIDIGWRRYRNGET